MGAENVTCAWGALEWAKVIVPGLITVVFGVWAAFIQRGQRDIAAAQKEIAAAQKEISHAKLNLDLFDRRYAIFEATWGFLSRASERATEGVYLVPAFTNEIPKARQLFGDEIATYMLEASSKGGKLTMLTRQVGSGASNEQLQELQDLEQWFYEEASQRCYVRFGEFLDFSRWRRDPPPVSNGGQAGGQPLVGPES